MESLDSPALSSLIQQLRTDILGLWPCQSLQVSLNPIMPLREVLASSCSPHHVVEQEHQHNHLGPDLILRRQIADSMPGFLRTLASNPPEDLLLVCAGSVYQRDREQQLQARHELAFWRLAAQDIPLHCLDELRDVVSGIFPRGMRLRTRRLELSYLVYSQGLEVYCGGWNWIGHCGLVNPMMLIESGFDPNSAHGLVLSLDLDRCLAVQERWDEICLRHRSSRRQAMPGAVHSKPYADG